MDREIADYVALRLPRFIEDLQNLVRKPSITANIADVYECAAFLKEMMMEAGVKTSLISSRGNPVLIGEVEGESNKALLVYSHYDVQPPDPSESWVYPPFSATIDGSRIVGRGAADSKGNIMAFLKAVQAYVEAKGSLPATVKFLFEGEEELGSPNLPHFIEANKPFLAAEAVVCFDGGLHASGRPQIELGLKGLLSVELSCRTADLDLHSMWAPVIENAAWRLIKAMSTLRSSDGRIAVEGWYSSVCPPPLEALSALDSILFDEEQLQKEFGITSFVGGVKGREALRLLIFEPTANISGISAGYIGLGFKTVLPSSATARIDFRLVPEQDPKTLFVLLKSHLARNGFSDIKVTPLSSVEPSRTPISAPIFKVVASAASKVYMADPVVYPNSPGSGPDFLFTKRLGLKSVWTGCSPPFSNAHAPNEFTTVDAYRSGILYAVDIIEEFGKSLPSD